MEVASPLTYVPTGTKRSLGYSPAHEMDAASSSSPTMETATDGPLLSHQSRSTKRQRCFLAADASVDSLSNAFSSPSAFFNNNGSWNAMRVPMQGSGKRQRSSRSSSPAQQDDEKDKKVEDLNRMVEEQAAVIESLKKDKTDLEGTLTKLQSDHEKTAKENHILRRAVNIQKDRHAQAETLMKDEAQKYRAEKEEQIKKMEQVILSLRYHLQAQQSAPADNFMGGFSPRPPDVF